MGYYYYVKRQGHEASGSSHVITQNDWLEYLSIDPSLELDRARSEALDSEVASGNKEPTHARWVQWSSRIPDQQEAWIWLENGRLVAEDADESFRSKLFLVADAMNAIFVGQKGETFDSNGHKVRAAQRRSARPWWKFWGATQASS